MMRRSGGSVVVAVLLWLAATGTAVADDGAKEQAAKHAKLGDALRDMERYADAIAEYRAAWELVKEPAYVFDIAECHRLAGEGPQAIEHYERYLELAPEGDEAEAAHRHLEALRAATEAEPPADDAAAAEAATLREEEEARRREQEEAQRRADEEARKREQEEARRLAEQEEARRREEERRVAAASESGQRTGPGDENEPFEGDPFADVSLPSEEPAAPAPSGGVTFSSPASNGGRGMRAAGFVMAGAGVAVLSGGLAFGAKARNLSDELEELAAGRSPLQPWTEEELAKNEEGKSAERKQIVLTVVGGAAVLASAGLIAVGYVRRESSDGVAVSPQVTPTSAGVGIAGSF